MDEFIDILDNNGNFTGRTALKSEAHEKGLFHPTIHIWCYSASGKILLQQRGTNKETYPLKWDVSVAGHIEAGERPEVGAIREAKEEIDITIDLKKLERIEVLKKEVKHTNGIWDREFIHVFLYCLDEKTPLKRQKMEVEALEWVSLKDFEIWVINEDKKLINSRKEHHLSIIKKIVTNQFLKILF